jgi:hypothetical protein
LPRATNVLLLLPDLTDHQVKNALNEVTENFTEDGANQKAIDKRWVGLFQVFRSNSTLLAAVKRSMPKKKNCGNKNARGYSTDERHAK